MNQYELTVWGFATGKVLHLSIFKRVTWLSANKLTGNNTKTRNADNRLKGRNIQPRSGDSMTTHLFHPSPGIVNY